MNNGFRDDSVTEAIAWRHQLHQHPELAFAESRTADFVANLLGQWGYKVHRGLAGTGVIGTLSRGTSRRTIGIRADMDALPIQEETGRNYASRTPGAMHACGHDGHVAMALAAARKCALLDNVDGTVHFIFQPAEEGASGAKRMVADGLFTSFPCDTIYGLHNWPALPLGTCVARDGAMMAAFAIFEIEISGRGGHGAMPHETADPLLAGSQLVSSLQSVVSRNTSPLESAVVSVTQFQSGDTFNIIPDRCLLRGTTRWFSDEVGNILEERIRELSHMVASAFGCTAEVKYDRRSPATINNPAAAGALRKLASDPGAALRVVDSQPSMASEDFAYMLKEVPGCYFWLGAGSEHGLHSSHFDFNDQLLPIGTDLWVSLVRDSLRRA